MNPYGEVHVFRMSLWAEHLRHWEEIFRFLLPKATKEGVETSHAIADDFKSF
jgi:hypothetical protein